MSKLLQDYPENGVGQEDRDHGNDDNVNKNANALITTRKKDNDDKGDSGISNLLLRDLTQPGKTFLALRSQLKCRYLCKPTSSMSPSWN